jgi:hypothetical protein
VLHPRPSSPRFHFCLPLSLHSRYPGVEHCLRKGRLTNPVPSRVKSQSMLHEGGRGEPSFLIVRNSHARRQLPWPLDTPLKNRKSDSSTNN